jgi:hypothetical protein
VHHFVNGMSALKLQVVWLLAPLLCAAPDPFVGIWKLDSGKSTFTRGDPSIMLGTMQIEPLGNGLKSTASGANGEGFASDFTFTCSLDGTPCKILASMPLRGANAVDTVSLKRIDARTIAATGTHEGKLVYNDRRVVSADGDTMTVTRDGTTPEGKKYRSTLVLLRQH